MEKNKKMRKKISVFVILGIILLTIYTISFLTPLLWALITSVRFDLDFDLSPFFFNKGEKIYFQNYVDVFNTMKIPAKQMNKELGVLLTIGNVYIEEQLYNSLIYSLICTLMATFTPCICAYAVAKYKFKFGQLLYGIVIVTMVMPTIGNLAAQIQIAQALGFYDTLLGVAIMKGHFLGSNFLIFYAAFKSLPNDYKDAAEIDGASQLQVLLNISLPLISTTISTIALLSFIGFWNDYSTAMIFLPSKPTVSYALYTYTRNSSDTMASGSVTRQVAACMLVTIPIFTVFMLLRNKLMGNLTMGGLKG